MTAPVGALARAQSDQGDPTALKTVEVRGPSGALDLRVQEPAGGAAQADILFVHGAWSSNWYWEAFLMPYFAARGFRAAAISLRAHGRSEGALRWASVRDYVADVLCAATHLDNPIIVGHSMGGFVVQSYAQQHAARAIVLMASVPPRGAWHAVRKLMRDRPGVLLRTLRALDLYPIIRDRDLARRLILSRGPDETDMDHVLEPMQSESFRAFLDMLFKPVKAPRAKDTPFFVMGGANDHIIPVKDIEATARHYGTSAVILPQISHMLPNDVGWEGVAEAMYRWIDDKI